MLQSGRVESVRCLLQVDRDHVKGRMLAKCHRFRRFGVFRIVINEYVFGGWDKRKNRLHWLTALALHCNKKNCKNNWNVRFYYDCCCCCFAITTRPLNDTEANSKGSKGLQAAQWTESLWSENDLLKRKETMIRFGQLSESLHYFIFRWNGIVVFCIFHIIIYGFFQK